MAHIPETGCLSAVFMTECVSSTGSFTYRSRFQCPQLSEIETLAEGHRDL